MFVSIDPGNDSGWAIYNPNRLFALQGLVVPNGLVACGLGDPRSSALHVIGHIDRVLIEKSRLRPRGEPNPNSIVELMTRAGEWCGMYRTHVIDVEYVLVTDWKGSIPKDKHHPRIFAKLTPYEKEILAEGGKGLSAKKLENVMDAIGLALWAAKR